MAQYAFNAERPASPKAFLTVPAGTNYFDAIQALIRLRDPEAELVQPETPITNTTPLLVYRDPNPVKDAADLATVMGYRLIEPDILRGGTYRLERPPVTTFRPRGNVRVEARQLKADDGIELLQWLSRKFRAASTITRGPSECIQLSIRGCPEPATPGDWIVHGPTGLKVMTDEEFTALYKEAA